MKKVVKLTLALTLIFVMALALLCSCANNNKKSNDNGNGKLNVIATSFPQYDFVRQIAGDKVNLSMLIAPGAEVHTFEPTPKDIMNIANCDVFVYTGGESDEWVKGIIQSSGNENMTVISFMDSAKLYEEQTTEGMQDEADEHGEDVEKVEYDEHVWTSPVNAIRIVKAIAQALCEADNGNSDYYKENCEKYTSELSELDAEYRRVIGEAKTKTIVVGDRFPFLYMAKEYGLDYYAAFPGCASNVEASASTIKFLIDKVKEESIPVVFHVEFSNEKISDTICESTGAKPLLLHSCHNVSADDFKKGVTYLDLMNSNLVNLSEALN